MPDFEILLGQVKTAVERFVKFKISIPEDAQDILQETYLTAYQKFDQLKNAEAFKPWIISIARNKCNDYFREKAAVLEIPIEEAPELVMDDGRMGISEVLAVRDNLEKMADRDKEILYLYFWKQMPQEEIAKRMGVPIGTVKSRLFTAKQKFRESYERKAGTDLKGSYEQKAGSALKGIGERKAGTDLKESGEQQAGTVLKESAGRTLPHKIPAQGSHSRGNYSGELKGEGIMKRLPEEMLMYTITAKADEPFEVKWEELMGWFLMPKLGESLSWGMYDQPSGKCNHVYDMKVTGRAKVHGIEGVELTARESSYSKKTEVIERTFVAQLTDTHCRYLASIRNDNGVRNYITFLDGDEFMECWGYGEDNVGNETNLKAKGLIQRDRNIVTTQKKDFVLDIVGRYDVTIGGKTYDTVCVLDISTYNNGVVSEQFLDRNGRTILWRRFNRDDWHIERYGGKLWSEQLPDNDRLIVDGVTYVQWYDCITDYIL